MKIIFKKLLKINRPLTPLEKVDNAKLIAENALGMFAKANAQLDVAIGELEEAQREAETRADALLRQAERAKTEIKMNRAVQEKLKEFTV